MSKKDITDAPIPDVVDKEAVAKKISGNHLADFVAAEGAKLLARTNRPNVITYAQFEPFLPIFRVDKERYNNDDNYNLEIRRLCDRYRKELNINFYQPTLVIRSEEDRTVLYYLDRIWTSFVSSLPDKNSHRESIPSAVTRTSSVTRDMMLLDASLKDIAEANMTPESLEYYKNVKKASAVITKMFTENNLNPALREEIAPTTVTDNNNDISFEVDDSE
jgi:hypothetical protein